MYDKDLKPDDVQSISNVDEVAGFFDILGYDTSARIKQTPANLGITAEGLIKEIKNIELIANQEGLFQVYLFELSSVTIVNTQAIVRAFRNRAGNYLLVVTNDFNRIDFILIERRLPRDEQDSGIGKKQSTVRPRVLTVERLKPTRIDLRVLNRFTYTESDPYLQYEKLKAAYDIADWSEEFFNNRALFSDYYLLERLSDEPEWRENIKPLYSQFRELYQNARSEWSGKSEKEFRKEFLEQIFEALGFSYKECKPPDDDSNKPDYALFEKSLSDKSLCLCLTYPWGRSLDGKDYSRDKDTPDENPGAVVVSILDREEVPWVIVTNGKLWRLYSSKAHSRATNYYEIDLEEVMARLDPEESFRFFYLFFRREAFISGEDDKESVTFLDRVTKGSEEYAKKLGERLKKRIFENIFPHFADGFIEYIRNEKGVSHLSDDDLDAVYHGTLTFLYRILFVLYSESRSLLPVKEYRGYHTVNLAALKTEIAEILGDVTIDNIKLLAQKKLFDANSTGLYDRLLKLFNVIDTGDASINVPHYNGGLFMTEVVSDDSSHEAQNAGFLLENKIPDIYLAYGLDLLARDEDDKTFNRVFIDYKSLSVRHLGSIYEGLLEFHVRIASEKMAICKGKKTEEVIPYQIAIKEKRKILETGRGKSAAERILPKGTVYLENTKHERKATGSYYTPDYIVKYIVENTVGPVLKDKFNKITPKFREAQMAYREAVNRKEALEKKGMKGDDPEKTAFTFSHLVDELFDIKVLDPAMGSGHFLVDAVDFITDKIIDFLNGFPWNPVLATIRETRDTILKEMESRGITIDESRLNDLNLLKRHVLKRCIYGVDLNPMAVELAKVSLWLDCFTLGAPLSFLDHHLKCGNSLIGTTVEEVKKALHEDQLGLFGSRFAGLMLATDLMRHIGELSDVTAAQVKESRSEYRKASDSLAPFRRILDMYVSQWFGNEGQTKGKKKKSESSPALEFLQSGEAEAFINTRDLNRAKDKLSENDRKIVQTAMGATKAKRFFHWELEFPEVFYEKGKKKESPGFDAVIGNPPYDVLASEELGFDISQDLTFYENAVIFETAIRGKKNLYKLFICLGTSLIRRRRYGMFSYIVPMALLGDDQSAGVRRYLLEETGLIKIESFPQKDNPSNRVFPEAKLSTAIFVTRATSTGKQFKLRTHPGRLIGEESSMLKIDPQEILAFDPENSSIPSCTQHDWDLVVRIINLGNIKRMNEVAKSFQGEVNETNERKKGAFTDNSKAPLCLRGASICLYTTRKASQGEDIYINVSKFLSSKEEGSKAYAHKHKRIGFQRSSPQNNFRRIISAPILKDNFCLDTVSYVTKESSKIDLDLLLALLNSKILDWYFRLGSTNSKVNEYQFNALPVPSFSETGQSVKWKGLLNGKQWDALSTSLCEYCTEPGVMPKPVADALSELCREIQKIEAKRVLKNRQERSSLASDSQQIQNVIDKVLFRCYGLSDDDGEYINKRLKEML